MKNILIYCSVVFFTVINTSSILAQSPCTSMEAYDYAQSHRNQAWKYYDSLPKSPDLINLGIAILDSTLNYLDQPRVIELANDNLYLRYRKFDVTYDIAVGYGLLGDSKKALEYLKRIALVDPGSPFLVERINREESFKDMHELPEYKELVKKYQLMSTLFDDKYFHTKYSDNLSNSEKILGLTLFWTEVKNKFVNFDHLPGLNWNKIYLEYLSKILDSKTTLEYYQLMQKMCALLKDGHTNVYAPQELTDSVYARPQIRTMLVENKVIIWKILNDSLKKNGFKIGQEIVKINGIPVHQYAEQFVEPYMSSSTPQDLRIRTYTYALLAGNINEKIDLELKEGEKIFSKSIYRTNKPYTNPTPDFEFKLLAKNIGYVALNSFGSEKALTLFKENLNAIMKTDGLILDVRLNGGGSGGVGFNILGYLTDNAFFISKSSYRGSPDNLTWKVSPAMKWKSFSKEPYRKPVVVLTGSMTFSAAEDFVVAFDFMKRGKIIGEPTGGSTGQPYSLKLPGGLTSRICMKRDTYPDGKEFVGFGVQPDIIVSPKISDIKDGKDPVLNKAIEYLSSFKKR
jgi:carboxyl-terminal processing protease